MGNPYATDESPQDLWFEQTLYAGNALGLIAYGIHITVWTMAMYHIWMNRKKRSPWFYTVFVTSLFISGTLCLVMEIYYGQKAWVDQRNYPGGPLGYLYDAEAQPINIVGAVFSTVIVLIGDGLLIWRAYIVWECKLVVIILPVLQWLVVGVLGFVFAYAQSLPESTLYAAIAVKVGLPYFALEMALNVFCTILIIVPLLRARQLTTAALGHRHAQMYTSIISIIIESALPNAVFSLIFIALYARNNLAENLIITLLLQVQCIAPELIMLRVATGQAWDKTTATQITRPDLRTPESSSAHDNSGMEFGPVTDTMMDRKDEQYEV